MKKKAIALVMSVMMLCGVAATAHAAPSVQAEAAPAVAQAVTASGKAIAKEDLTITAVKDVAKLPAESAKKLEKAHNDIVSASSVKAFLNNAGIAKDVEKVAKVENLAISSMFDVTASGAAKAELDANGSVTISFSIPELKAGDVAVVLHMGANGWEVVPSTVSNGVVSATFTSLSPVVVMVENSAGARSVASPQTGYANFEGILICGALVSACALAYSLKRRYAA